MRRACAVVRSSQWKSDVVGGAAAEIALGEHGPKFRLEVTATQSAGAGSRIMPIVKTVTTTTDKSDAPPAQKPSVIRPLVVISALIGALVIALAWFGSVPSKTHDDASVAARMESLIKATKEELRNEASATNQKHDDELRDARRKMQSTLLDVDSSIATAKDKADAAAKQAANVKGDTEMFLDAARKYELAVVLVQGGCSATAFAVGPRVFATNSHVSKPTREALQEGRDCVVVLRAC